MMEKNEKMGRKGLWILCLVVILCIITMMLLCGCGSQEPELPDPSETETEIITETEALPVESITLLYPWGTAEETIAAKETVLEQKEFGENSHLRCDMASSELDGIPEFDSYKNEVLFAFENGVLESVSYSVNPGDLTRQEQWEMMVKYYGENYHVLDVQNMYFWLIGDTVVVYYTGEVSYFFADHCTWAEELRALQGQ